MFYYSPDDPKLLWWKEKQGGGVNQIQKDKRKKG